MSILNETEAQSSAATPQRLRALAIGAAVYIGLLFVGMAVGGELGQIALAGLNALPFAALAALAYLGEGRRFNWAQVAAGLWLALLAGSTALAMFGSTFLALTGGADTMLTPAQLLRLGLVALGILLAIVAGALCLLPLVRRAVARVLPIDPTSFVHAIALACVISVGLACFVPLLVLGEPPFLAMIGLLSEGEASEALRDNAGQLRDQIYGLIWTIPATMLAVGYGIRRTLHQTLDRLGLVRPTWRQALFAVGLAVLLAFAVQVLSLGIDWLWRALGWPVTDQEAFDELISFAFSPIGAAVLGLTAGLGEELAVRGVLQPRLGILLSDLFFVSLHALQYNWDALLVVFLVGLVCGLVRRRTNTSTAAIVHGTYNFTLVIITLIFAS